MKKILLAASLLIAATSFAGSYNAPLAKMAMEAKKGRHIPASQVPAPVKATFSSMFPTATNVQWEVEKDNGQVVYTASFRVNGKSQKARFSADGTYIG